MKAKGLVVHYFLGKIQNVTYFPFPVINRYFAVCLNRLETGPLCCLQYHNYSYWPHAQLLLSIFLISQWIHQYQMQSDQSIIDRNNRRLGAPLRWTGLRGPEACIRVASQNFEIFLNIYIIILIFLKFSLQK